MAEKKVLVIDDDPEILGVIQDYLLEQGYDVVASGSAEDGLQQAEKNHPDLIILDVELPDMNGYEVCKRIRENSRLIHTPIILLTAHSMERDEIAGLNAGADDFVPKPFKPARLLARIQTAITRNQRELDANALTHLPGNPAILEEIQKRIAENKPYSIVYIDLNNFKAFNDRYGFLRGDDAIKKTAEILQSHFEKWKSSNSFLGHIGGDDFVGIVDSHDVYTLCVDIITEFDRAILELYDEYDRRKREIVSVNRKGEKIQIPIMGMAIAVVTNHFKTFKHPGEIALVAGDLKKWVKSEVKSAFLIDRRT